MARNCPIKITTILLQEIIRVVVNVIFPLIGYLYIL